VPVAVTVRHRVAFQTRNIVARLADSLTDSPPLVDGWAEPESIEVLESSNLTLREAAPRIAWRCHYAPGRSYGEPVRVLVTQRFVFRRGR
jgi:hypothetical protein